MAQLEYIMYSRLTCLWLWVEFWIYRNRTSDWFLKSIWMTRVSRKHLCEPTSNHKTCVISRRTKGRNQLVDSTVVLLIQVEVYLMRFHYFFLLTLDREFQNNKCLKIMSIHVVFKQEISKRKRETCHQFASLMKSF